MDRPGLAILVNSDDPFNAKTAVGVSGYGRDPIVALVDPECAGRTAADVCSWASERHFGQSSRVIIVGLRLSLEVPAAVAGSRLELVLGHFLGRRPRSSVETCDFFKRSEACA